MSELSARIQTAIVILCTSLYAARKDDLVQQAADSICRDFTRQLTGRRAEDRDFRAVTKLGEAIAKGGFSPLTDVAAMEILMPYEQ